MVVREGDGEGETEQVMWMTLYRLTSTKGGKEALEVYKDEFERVCECGDDKQTCRDMFASVVMRVLKGKSLTRLVVLPGRSWKADFKNTAEKKILEEWPHAKVVGFEKDKTEFALISREHHLKKRSLAADNLQLVQGRIEDPRTFHHMEGSRAAWIDLCGYVTSEVLVLLEALIERLLLPKSVLAVTVCLENRTHTECHEQMVREDTQYAGANLIAHLSAKAASAGRSLSREAHYVYQSNNGTPMLFMAFGLAVCEGKSMVFGAQQQRDEDGSSSPFKMAMYEEQDE